MSSDPVNNPPHYNHGQYEVIDIIEDLDLGYHLGNVIKYIARAEYKGERLQDLKKGRWYLDRYIQILEQKLKKEQEATVLYRPQNIGRME